MILATNPNAEGDATTLCIHKQHDCRSTETQCANAGENLTRDSRGMPVGSPIGYASRSVLTHALDGRRTLEPA